MFSISITNTKEKGQRFTFRPYSFSNHWVSFHFQHPIGFARSLRVKSPPAWPHLPEFVWWLVEQDVGDGLNVRCFLQILRLMTYGATMMSNGKKEISMLSADIFSTIGDRTLSQKARQVGLSALIRSGLPPSSACAIQNTMRASNQALERIIGISYRTLQRHMEKSSNLSPVASDRIVRFLSVLHDASKTLGTVESGVSWMNRPCQPLGNQKPIEMLDTVAGTSEVVDILGRIRHGVFS